jgi:uncharacterized membrane protein YqiK
MATESGNNRRTIIVIVVIAILVALIYYWTGFRDKGAPANPTYVQSPDRSGSGAERTQRSAP